MKKYIIKKKLAEMCKNEKTKNKSKIKSFVRRLAGQMVDLNADMPHYQEVFCKCISVANMKLQIYFTAFFPFFTTTVTFTTEIIYIHTYILIIYYKYYKTLHYFRQQMKQFKQDIVNYCQKFTNRSLSKSTKLKKYIS